MNETSWVARLVRWADRYFLLPLLAAYCLAAAFPAPGSWLAGVTLGECDTGYGCVRVTPQTLLLGSLLFAAAFTTPAGCVLDLLRRPAVLFAGLAACLVAPLALLLAAAQAFPGVSGLDPDRAQGVVLGLGMVAAMPVAGSSAAWSRKAGGDVALSLGLVLGSTLLSPLTAPFVLAAVGRAAGSGELGVPAAGAFLGVCVLLPTAAGLLAARVAGPTAVERARGGLKSFNMAALLVLVYAGASAALAHGEGGLELDFAAVVFAAGAVFCVASFAAGWVVARLVNARRGEETALVYGLGMSNNGTGMVLAATAPGGPVLLLVLTGYTLIQHVAAGVVDLARSRRCEPLAA